MHEQQSDTVDHRLVQLEQLGATPEEISQVRDSSRAIMDLLFEKESECATELVIGTKVRRISDGKEGTIRDQFTKREGRTPIRRRKVQIRFPRNVATLNAADLLSQYTTVGFDEEYAKEAELRRRIYLRIDSLRGTGVSIPYISGDDAEYTRRKLEKLVLRSVKARGYALDDEGLDSVIKDFFVLS